MIKVPASRYTVQRLNGLMVITFFGAIEERTLSYLRAAFADPPPTPALTIVLDMTHVPFVDSEGFGALIHIQKELTEQGRRLALFGCREPVQKALSLTRLEILLPSYPTLESLQRER